MSIQVIDGDLFDTTAKYICHQVNCKGKMGSGVAKQIREKYPEVYDAYRVACSSTNEDGTPKETLGMILPVPTKDGKVICNLFAQKAYGYDGGQYTNYTAFKRCLVHLTEYVPAGETIAMPYGIGCGLGGGNWEIIEWYLKDVLQDQYTVELWRKG